MIGVGEGEGELPEAGKVEVAESELGVGDGGKVSGDDEGEGDSVAVGDGVAVGVGDSLGCARSVGVEGINSSAITRATWEKSMRTRKPAIARFIR